MDTGILTHISTALDIIQFCIVYIAIFITIRAASDIFK
jgi:hypothetical protein